MVIERSRKWVKERIPAFICKETNWWVSRWIQANIFLCPHCRKEYRSLKSVWSFLDSWESDTPSGDLEENFSCKFREQFPSAFKTAEDEGKSRLIPSIIVSVTASKTRHARSGASIRSMKILSPRIRKAVLSTPCQLR